MGPRASRKSRCPAPCISASSSCTCLDDAGGPDCWPNDISADATHADHGLYQYTIHRCIVTGRGTYVRHPNRGSEHSRICAQREAFGKVPFDSAGPRRPLRTLIPTCSSRERTERTMKALVYHGPGMKAWEDVPKPT